MCRLACHADYEERCCKYLAEIVYGIYSHANIRQMMAYREVGKEECRNEDNEVAENAADHPEGWLF